MLHAPCSMFARPCDDGRIQEPFSLTAFAGSAGDAVLFYSLKPDGDDDIYSLHAG